MQGLTSNWEGCPDRWGVCACVCMCDGLAEAQLLRADTRMSSQGVVQGRANLSDKLGPWGRADSIQDQPVLEAELSTREGIPIAVRESSLEGGPQLVCLG